MNDCPRFGKWIGGCKFSPRYDEVKRRRLSRNAEWGTVKFKGPRGTLNDAMNPADVVTYVRDVCQRCGKTVERK